MTKRGMKKRLANGESDNGGVAAALPPVRGHGNGLRLCIGDGAAIWCAAMRSMCVRRFSVGAHARMKVASLTGMLPFQ